MLPLGCSPHEYPLNVENSPVNTPFSVYLTEVYRGDCTIKLSGSSPFSHVRSHWVFRYDTGHDV